MSDSGEKKGKASGNKSTEVRNVGEKKDGQNHKKKREKKENEERKINRLVKRKLENYMNQEKREMHFDPMGYYRTSPRMHKYDLMYKVIESTALEKAAHEKRKKENKDSQGKTKAPSPTLVKNSRRITLESEAFRLTQNVASVLDTLPMRELAKLHSSKSGPGRLKTKDEKALWMTHNLPPIQGYSSHVGSILHGKKYMDYYISRGLKGRTDEFKQRLGDLKKSKCPDDGSSWTDYDSESYLSETSLDSSRSSLPGDEKETNETIGDKNTAEDTVSVSGENENDDTAKEENGETTISETPDTNDQDVTEENVNEKKVPNEETSKVNSNWLSVPKSRPSSSDSDSSFIRSRTVNDTSTLEKEVFEDAPEEYNANNYVEESQVHSETCSEASEKSEPLEIKNLSDEDEEKSACGEAEGNKDNDYYSDDFERDTPRDASDVVVMTSHSRPSSSRSQKSETGSMQTYISLEHAALQQPQLVT